MGIVRGQKGLTMTQQELFEKMSELECKLYYLADRTNDEEAWGIDDLAREILEAYVGMTGCHNQ